MKNNLETINNIQGNYLSKHIGKKLIKEYSRSQKQIILDTKNLNKTLNVLNQNYRFSIDINKLKKFNKFSTIAIIGMGGSILGAQAIYNFLEHKIKKKFYFFDDLDIKKNLFFQKKNLNKILFIVISKSGHTIETLSNFLNLNIIKKNSKNIIIISEKTNNPLYMIAKNFNFFFVEHKKNIGGRYSVLSEVGIVPAYLMGLNISKLRSNTHNYLIKRKKLFLKESVIKLANLLKQNKIQNLIFLNYAPELKKFLFWCQQLIAESLGKKEKGFLPVISTAPKDHHSLLQLYMDGPKNKLIHIFSIEREMSKKIKINNFLKKNHFLNKKSLADVKKAQKNALIKILKNKKIPYREFKLKNLNEEVLGELFSYFILETVLIGKLVNINPYDQPGVEQVKVWTKKFLS